MVCVMGAIMPYCMRILIRSIGLRCMSVARSRTVMAVSTTTSLGSVVAAGRFLGAARRSLAAGLSPAFLFA